MKLAICTTVLGYWTLLSSFGLVSVDAQAQRPPCGIPGSNFEEICESADDDSDPSGYSIFCKLLDETGFDLLVFDDKEKNTIFLPVNSAFDTLAKQFIKALSPLKDDPSFLDLNLNPNLVARLVKLHIVNKFVAPGSLKCGDEVITLGPEGKLDGEKTYPLIKCIEPFDPTKILNNGEAVAIKDAIAPSISGGGNGYGAGTQPLFITDFDEALLKKCNANIYPIQNVITFNLKRILKKKTDVTCSPPTKSQAQSLTLARKKKHGKIPVKIDATTYGNYNNNNNNTTAKNNNDKQRRLVVKGFDKLPDTTILSPGLVSLLDPLPPNQEILSEAFTANGFCPEDADTFCVNLCKKDKKCTAVETINFDPPAYRNGKPTFGCSLFDGSIKNYPLKKTSFPDDLAKRIVATTYVKKKGPEVKEYPTSLLVPETVQPPQGSDDYKEFIFPAALCVATKGFTAGFNRTLADECRACVFKSLFVFQSCSCITKAICQDGALFGKDGSCNDKCGPSQCIGAARTAALVEVGQPIRPFPFLKPPIPAGGFFSVCNVRDIFDPANGEFLPPYTCPDSSGDFDLTCLEEAGR